MPRLAVPALALVVVLAGCKPNEVNVGTFNTPPNASITLPVSGSTYDEGTEVSFQATVSDDAGAETVVLVWSSDIDGVLKDSDHPSSDGTAQFVTANLTPGNHVITLTATDSDAEQVQSTVQVGIIDLPEAPEIDVVHPNTGDHANEGDTFDFVASVSDAQDAATDLVVDVESDVQGSICSPMTVDETGIARCSAVLQGGDHLFTFTVTDTDGETAQATSYFAVTPLSEIDNDGDGFTETQGDCDDTNSAIKPGAIETENGLDDDCDSLVDEGTNAYDDDGDGYSENQGDCNDATTAQNPSVTESCNGSDDNCNGATDEAGAIGCSTYYYDWDGDSYGDNSNTACQCASSVDYHATRGGDCYDFNGSASPQESAYHNTQRGDGSYDYNCDGVESVRYTAQGSCSGWPLCDTTAGWLGGTPSCGTQRSWLDSCSTDWTSCDQTTHTATQECL